MLLIESSRLLYYDVRPGFGCYGRPSLRSKKQRTSSTQYNTANQMKAPDRLSDVWFARRIKIQSKKQNNEYKVKSVYCAAKNAI